MTRWSVVALALLGVVQAARAVDVGQPAPLLVAADSRGEMQRLSTLRGRVVYVDFWASWCAPCLSALPAYEALYRELGERGFQVIAVNVDAERDAALRFLRRHPVSYPVVFDAQGQWPEIFDVRAMPSGYLIGRDGVVRHVQTGFRSGDAEKLKALIVRQLAEPS